MRTCAPANIAHFCVTPIEHNKIKLLNAPADIIDIFRQTVTEVWTSGIQSESALAVQLLSVLTINITRCTVNVLQNFIPAASNINLAATRGASARTAMTMHLHAT